MPGYEGSFALIAGEALMRLLAFVLVALLCLQTTANATCERDCNAECCSDVSFTPWDKTRICEPICKSTCEAAKATCRASDGAINLPHIPSQIELVEKALNQSCAMAFEMVTNFVVMQQGYEAASGRDALDEAKEWIVRSGVFPRSLVDEVTVRWCEIDASGMAPDRNLICISPAIPSLPDVYKNDNDGLTMLGLAKTLAHEYYHAWQYRQMGTDNFKCQYSKAYLECDGCQDFGHPLEADAYNFEHQAGQVMEAWARDNGILTWVPYDPDNAPPPGITR